VGSFEDTASEYLIKTGQFVTEIDPDINMDLHTFMRSSLRNNRLFRVVFSTSVIEHVEKDEEFLSDICELLEPGGLGIITCDFKNDWKAGDPVIVPDFRFYTEKDLKFRLGKIIQKHDCELVDCPDWTGKPDFNLGGFDYSFATFVFRKDNK
jgi:SAM-dependent methyltransferase